jgi:hypothetical protein
VIVRPVRKQVNPTAVRKKIDAAARKVFRLKPEVTR